MTNAELLAKIREEIEQRIHEISHPLKDGYEIQSIGKIEGLSELLDFLSTLEEQAKYKVRNPIFDECVANVDPEVREEVRENIDFKQALYDHFGQVKDFTLGMRIGKYFYELGCRRTAEKYDEIEYNRQREEEKPMTPDDVMKELDEKIALVKQRGTWDGVDVDKYMDEVRGREPEKPMNQDELEDEMDRFFETMPVLEHENIFDVTFQKIARHFAKWGKEQGYREGFFEGTKIQRKEDDQYIDTIYQQGIEKGKDEILDNSVIVECGVRVYPELDEEPVPWVSLYKHGINCDSLKDIPELENLGFRDDDTAIVIIKRKGER